jgi:predicted RNase H-like HicB family nuclease
MKNVYPVIFTQTNDEKNTVLISVPDLDIMSEGYGINDAIEMARDVIGATGLTLEDMGKDIPEPSKMGVIDASASEFANCGESFISLVDIDFTDYRRKVEHKSVRRNVTIPNWLNQEAEKAHLNVSKVLQEALIAKLNMPAK